MVVVSPAPAAHADEPKAAATEEQAIAAAKQSGEPVEITSRRGENRTVRALPNGRIEVEERLRPIRARQGGQWADIDATLHRSGGAIVPVASTVGLRFSTGGTGPMVEMTRAGRKLSLTWPQPLPEPTLEGDTAVYTGVAGPDVDLRLRAEGDGFAHVLVIKTAEAAQDPRVAKVALAMSTTRLAVSEEQGSGVLKAADTGSGSVVFEAPSPMMWDSSQASAAVPQARAATAVLAEEPAEGAKTAPIEVNVGDGSLTLTPNQGLLTAPDTTFPVYIDPVWDTKKASSWGMVSSGWPDQSYYKFAGKSTEGMGRCEVAKDGNCVKNQTKRLFFRMSLPAISGRYIQNVEFTPFETSAYNCSNPTSVQLWRTNTLQSYATWNNTNSSSVWDAHLASRDVVHCSTAPVEFGGSTLRAHVQDAVNKGYSTITFGLKAYSESTMDWWKRFADDAYLHVQYNNPPKQPDTDTMFADPGGTCASSANAKWVNRVPTVYATLIDPDTEDKSKVQGQFTLHWANNADGSDWGPKWTSSLTPAKTSGTPFSQPLPSTIPKNTRIGWGVRAWDGEQWGPWSYSGAQTGCYFYYDPDLPAEPTISSSDYPEDGTWHDGVGIPGTFVISDSAQLADRYELWLNGFYYKTVSTTAGAARQVQVAPSISGPNHLDVVAFTPSSQKGTTYTYNFLANIGKPAKARFPLDEQSGNSLQVVTRDGEPAITATAHGGVVVGAEGHVSNAIKLDGSTGYASTDAPALDTSKSFTVSTWVWLDPDAVGNDFTALSAEGTSGSAFYLKYVKNLQRWVFAGTAADSDTPGWWQAESKAAAQTAAWTHLVGVWDSALGRLRIYVNGDVGTDSAEVTSLWNAAGGLQIGRAKYAGNQVDYWPGLIDDVRVYDRSIGGPEVQELVKQYPVLKGRWKLNSATNLASPGEPTDWAVPPLVLHNGAEVSPTAGFVGEWVSEGGLLLNQGTGGFAETSLGLETDQSFTITAWARSLDRPQQPVTVFSQAGTHANAVTLRYMPGADPEVQGSWQAEMRNSDDAAEPPLVVSHPAFLPGEWAHLAVVYDALRDRLSLYVNGQLQQTSDEVSQEDGVRGFDAQNGGLQVGRNKLGTASGTEFWRDEIDDVWAYRGALTKTQIQKLAAPEEWDTSDGP